jgi:hypothetical protein
MIIYFEKPMPDIASDMGWHNILGICAENVPPSELLVQLSQDTHTC